MSTAGEETGFKNVSGNGNIETGPEGIPGYPVVVPVHSSDSSRVFFSQDSDDRLVVVKQLVGGSNGNGAGGEEDSGGSIARERFVHEAQVHGRLSHSQIPELLENNTDHFTPHMVIAPILGVRDPETFDTAPDSLAASRIIYSVLGAMSYLHSKDIVHRDIKPSNMLARWTGETALTDFGLAAERQSFQRPVFKIGSGNSVEEPDIEVDRDTFYQAHTGITPAGGVMGTMGYASPEQAMGKGVDIPGDIYSLGVAYYKMLYGRLPFNLKDPNEQTILNMLEAKIDFTVPEGRDVPGPLIEVIERATQQDPHDRYQSAEEMKEGLARAMRAVGRISLTP